MTRYTDKELRREAVMAIRYDAKAAKVKARCIGYTLLILDDCSRQVILQAHGERTDAGAKGHRFDVNIAL